MTATDELRALLDERGVKWTYDSGTYRWRSGRHPFPFAAWAFNDELLTVSAVKVTPAQAIAATLGRGTCKRLWTGSEMICSECAHQMNDPTANFCPSCGAEVVDG